jgi:hypothetical protein
MGPAADGAGDRVLGSWELQYRMLGTMTRLGTSTRGRFVDGAAS